MISIRLIGPEHVLVIQDLAWRIWNAVYTTLISQEQIDYMLGTMYTPASIQEQMDAGHRFWMAYDGSRPVGFMSVSAHPVISGRARIHKLYLLPTYHGHGIGKELLSHAENWARKRNLKEIELNVNRGNPAQHFYARNGFNILRLEDLRYGNFWLNDYVVLKTL